MLTLSPSKMCVAVSTPRCFLFFYTPLLDGVEIPTGLNLVGQPKALGVLGAPPFWATLWNQAPGLPRNGGGPPGGVPPGCPPGILLWHVLEPNVFQKKKGSHSLERTVLMAVLGFLKMGRFHIARNQCSCKDCFSALPSSHGPLLTRPLHLGYTPAACLATLLVGSLGFYKVVQRAQLLCSLSDKL